MFKNKMLLLFILLIFFIDLKQIYFKYNQKEVEKNKIEYTLNKEINYKIKGNVYDILLIIPKIKLRVGMYSKDDKRNNIEETVMIHYNSNYPNVENSNLILIAHSGSGEKAYFKNLAKLDYDSLIEIYYDHVKYVYKIESMYKVDKTGKVGIKRNKDKKAITLITCDQIDKSKQIVYIGYIIDEIRY